MHQYLQATTPQQPHIRTIPNRRRGLQGPVLDTSAGQIVYTCPTQLGTQLWPKVKFPRKPAEAAYIYADALFFLDAPKRGRAANVC